MSGSRWSTTPQSLEILAKPLFLTPGAKVRNKFRRPSEHFSTFDDVDESRECAHCNLGRKRTVSRGSSFSSGFAVVFVPNHFVVAQLVNLEQQPGFNVCAIPVRILGQHPHDRFPGFLVVLTIADNKLNNAPKVICGHGSPRPL
jgi:hypothetical protein